MTTPTPTLYAALAAARLEFGAVVKDKTAKIASQKGNYSYTYADLASVIEATAPALAKHGLSIIQEPEIMMAESGIWLTLHGSLCHAGGEVVPFRPLTMPVGTSADARAIGTAISYARRYQLISVLNIAAEADDDDAAGNTSLPAQRAAQPPEDPFMNAELKRQAEAYANAVHHQPEPEPIDDEEADDPQVDEETAKLRRKAHAIGRKIWGKKWPDVRHTNVGKLTEGRTQSLNAVTIEELRRIVQGLEEKQDALRQPEPEAV